MAGLMAGWLLCVSTFALCDLGFKQHTLTRVSKSACSRTPSVRQA